MHVKSLNFRHFCGYGPCTPCLIFDISILPSRIVLKTNPFYYDLTNDQHQAWCWENPILFHVHEPLLISVWPDWMPFVWGGPNSFNSLTPQLPNSLTPQLQKSSIFARFLCAPLRSAHKNLHKNFGFLELRS